MRASYPGWLIILLAVLVEIVAISAGGLLYQSVVMRLTSLQPTPGGSPLAPTPLIRYADLATLAAGVAHQTTSVASIPPQPATTPSTTLPLQPTYTLLALTPFRPTATVGATATVIPTATPTVDGLATQRSLVATEVSSQMTQIVLSHSPTPTVTSTTPPSATPTPSATITPRPLPTATRTATPITIGSNCRLTPDSAFTSVWQNHRQRVGCPLGPAQLAPLMAEQAFQGGHFFYKNDPDFTFAIYDRDIATGATLTQGTWVDDTGWANWNEIGEPDPEGIGLTPPPGLQEPRRGFGYVWRTYLNRENGPLGWARTTMVITAPSSPTMNSISGRRRPRPVANATNRNGSLTASVPTSTPTAANGPKC